jgi:hypothetical protein
MTEGRWIEQPTAEAAAAAKAAVPAAAANNKKIKSTFTYSLITIQLLLRSR